jgi:hypothetical protein
MSRSIVKVRPYVIEYQPITLIGSYYDYIDVNNDKFLRKSMINYFREKTKNWLITDFEANDCFSISGSNIKKVKCNKKNKKKEDDKKIAKYIYDKYVYPNRIVKNVLFEYTKKSGVNWYDLKMNKKYIKNILKNVIQKQIEK